MGVQKYVDLSQEDAHASVSSVGRVGQRTPHSVTSSTVARSVSSRARWFACVRRLERMTCLRIVIPPWFIV
jgi:hypothetical protein